MAKRYRPVQRDQVFLFPPSMRDWLPADHPVWLVIAAVDQMDTRPFHRRRKTGGAGAAGYDPDMLVTMLVWAYAHRVTSSRRIEQLCHTDVAFRVICGGNLPDHTTIARFREEFPEAVAAFFAAVLALCAALGMGRLGVVALDGTKIAASASKSANRSEEYLRKLAEETVARHRDTDAAEDDLFGPGNRGDEVPEDAWSPKSRNQRIAAALRSLREEREAAEADRQAAQAAHEQLARDYLDAAAAGTPRAGRPPAGTEVELARRNLDRARAARAAQLTELERRYAAGQPRRGRPAQVEDYCRVREAAAEVERARARAAEAGRRAAERERNRKGPGPVRNVTDPDSRLMPVRGGGFIQGYNAQNVTSADGLIIATELTGDTTDTGWFEPMLRQAEDAAALIAAHRPAAAPIGLVLADAGYCSEDNLTAQGPDRLIAVGKRHDLEKAAAGRPGAGRTHNLPFTRQMADRLKTEDAITAYRQRGHIAETPHGNIKHNMGLRQLSVRGKPKASAEWEFAAAVHNLFKAISSGHLTATTLSQLTTRASYPP
ncbi:MAG: transposase, partial [Actinobacteria bacterium]|nr:transposase [Actinomycetota bacterium]